MPKEFQKKRGQMTRPDCTVPTVSEFLLFVRNTLYIINYSMFYLQLWMQTKLWIFSTLEYKLTESKLKKRIFFKYLWLFSAVETTGQWAIIWGIEQTILEQKGSINSWILEKLVGRMSALWRLDRDKIQNFIRDLQ